MPSTKRRASSLALTGCLSFALAIAASGPTVAAEPSPDDPAATVNGLLDTLIAKDFAGMGVFVCEEMRDAAVQRFDMAQAFADLPPTVDVAGFIETLTVSTPDRTVTVVSNDGTTAIVQTGGSLVIEADETAAREFVRQLLQSEGLEGTDEEVEQYLPLMMGSVERPQDLDEEVTVVLEDGLWLVCDDFGSDDPSPSPSAAVGPSASMDPVAYAALLAAVPETLRASCEPDSSWGDPIMGADPGEVASVDCDPDGSGGIFATYSMFDSTAAMDAMYDEQLLGMQNMGGVSGPGCFAGPGEGTREGGRIFCYDFVGDAGARWTDEATVIMVNAFEDDGDWAALEAFVGSAGPVAP